MSKLDIYYFSGTGNSLFVARELQKRMPDATLIPMVSLLNQDVIPTHAETVGLVFPIYFTAIPVPVKKFIKRLDVTAGKYIFAIATRIGTTHSAFSDIDNILKKKGKGLDSYFSLNMAGNDPKFNYKVPTPEEIAQLEAVVLERLDAIYKIIANQEKSRAKDTNYTTRIHCLRLISLMLTLTGGLKDHLYADSKCNGCGTCTKVCLANKIIMINNQPVWRDNVKCYHCAACLNYCPKQSAQIKSFTEKNGRYPHPYATADDIAGQK